MELEEEIKALIEVDKLLEDSAALYYAPKPGDKLRVKLVSSEKKSEKFQLSIYEGAHSSALVIAIDAKRKTTLQTLHGSDPLVKIDIDQRAKHTNPDGTIITGSHVHVATKEFGAKFAFPINSPEIAEIVGGGDSVEEIFDAFQRFCHIDRNLQINWSLGV